MKPVQLAPNTLRSFYSGVGRIAEFRHDATVERDHAEDWIAATTTRFGSTDLGHTRLTDGSTLAAEFDTAPDVWLGPSYTAHYGAVGTVLVKLLDAGERLPLHVHPDRPFAAKHLDSPFGKSEAWLILHAEPGAGAHLGFRRDLDTAELDRLVADQQVEELLAACNEVPLRTGDVVFCPGGVPHAIGAGVLILEVQEMTDFSIMLEWAGFPLDPDDVFLGLDRATALDSVRHDAIVGAELDALQGRTIRSLSSGAAGITSLLPESSSSLFVAEQIIGDGSGVLLDQRFSVLVVNEGSGTLAGEEGTVEVSAGAVLAVPYAAGDLELSGAVSAIRCFPS